MMESNFSIYSILFIAVLGMSCQKTKFTELSEQDIQAAEQMQKAYEIAKVYNDSLVWCAQNGPACSDAFIAYCDSIVDYNATQYDFHHSVYSHTNDEDDHDHHGNSMEHHDSRMGHDPNHAVHDIESHEAMEKLMQNHIPYHIE